MESKEHVGRNLVEAMGHLQRAIGRMRQPSGVAGEKQVQNSTTINQLEEITATLQRCMIKNQDSNSVVNGKMECSSCGSNAVEVLPDHHDCGRSAPLKRVITQESNSTTPMTVPLRKMPKIQEEELEEQDLLLKSTPTTYSSSSTLMPPLKRQKMTTQKDEGVKTNDETVDFGRLLQSIFGQTSDSLPTDSASNLTTDFNDNKKENLDQNALNEILQNLLANSASPGLPVDISSDDDTVSMSSSSSALMASDELQAPRRSTAKLQKTADGYLCPHEGCTKVFKERGSVGRHLITHSGVRFKCDKCSASYTQKNALKVHMQVHSNPDLYRCEKCGFKYNTQNGLRQHQKSGSACVRQTKLDDSIDAMSIESSINDLIRSAIASGSTNLLVP